MPKNHKFWVPAHEAGHVIAAIAIGVLPEYTVIDTGGPTPFGVTVLPRKRPTRHEDEYHFSTAGLAAELHVWETEKINAIPENAMMDAALDRASEDIKAFFVNVNAVQMGLTTKTAKENVFIKWAAIEFLRPVLHKHLPLFEAVRSHLTRYAYLGQASLDALQNGNAPGVAELRADYHSVPRQHQKLVAKPAGV